MVNCIVIDNDLNVFESIRALGVDFQQLTFNSVNENQENALNVVLRDKPKIIFLNIESTTINILEFFFEINQFVESKPIFVALSASKLSAYQAYKYDFSDFILKPLNELSIRKSLLKCLKTQPITPIETICLKSYKDYQYLNIDDILFLKADNNTTDFYMRDGKVIGAYKTLKVFQNLLPSTFFRVHKSYIINRKCVSRIHYGKSICILNNEHQIPFTKTFIDNINLVNSNLYKGTIISLN